jgi:rhodanese-related sulfurtransferase
MSFKKWGAWVGMFLLIWVANSNPGNDQSSAFAHAAYQQKSPEIEFITVEELKARFAKKQPVTIIDVRGSSDLAEGSKIKGAIYVKLRRLRYRLAFAPLKDVPRDSEVVTYCACPSDEASIRAAQLLQDAGFKRVRALKGGWRAWLKASGPVDQMPRGM